MAEEQPYVPMLINTTQYCANVLAKFEVDSMLQNFLEATSGFLSILHDVSIDFD